MLAFTSSAQANDLTREFSAVKSGTVRIAPNAPVDIAPDPDTGQIDGIVNIQKKNKGHNGGSVEAIVNLDSNLVTFESGTATVGANARSTSISGIDITFENTNDGTINLSPFISTIIPAGMGFYVQDASGPPIDMNPFTGYGQSLTTTFGNFFNATGVGVFAEAAFDFQVTTLESTLYSLSGLVSLSFDANGNVIINENLTGPNGSGRFLNGFSDPPAINNPYALVYDWQATDILIPLTGQLSGYESQVVSYRANVTSWTNAPCINKGLNCIVAYSGFGDPVGRGGGVEEFAAFARGFSAPQANNNQDFVIRSLNFDPTTISVFRSAAVPEPTTWALMIGGFGLAGAALRRRRRVAYS